MTMVNVQQAKVLQPGAGKPMNVMGHAVTLKLSKDETAGATYVFEVSSPPGAGIPPHVHKNEDEIIYVAEGTYGVFLGGENFQAEAGSWLHFPRGVPHGFQNIGTAPGRTLWTVTPGENFEPFFTELSELPADQPPDLEKVAEIFDRYEIALLPPPEEM